LYLWNTINILEENTINILEENTIKILKEIIFFVSLEYDIYLKR